MIKQISENQGQDQPLLLRLPTVAKMLGISRAAAYNLAAAGKLPGVVRLGGSVRVSARALNQWLEACEKAGANQAPASTEVTSGGTHRNLTR
jgi:excisionase family DNA binding protein